MFYAEKEAMLKRKINTLNNTVSTLNREGFTEDFKEDENCITALYSHKEYQPEDLLIVESYRFKAKSNSKNEIALYAIISIDGKKGILKMLHSNQNSENVSLVKHIEKIKN